MFKLTFKSEDPEIMKSSKHTYNSKEECDACCDYIIIQFLQYLDMADEIEKHPVIKKYFNERNPKNHFMQYVLKTNLPKKALCLIYNKIFEGEWFTFSIEEI